MCIRAGYVALRRIADFFDIRHNPDPHWPEESISIDRREFDQVCRELADAGVPLKADLEQAWRDFAGWRGQLRPGAAGTGRADHGPVRAVVLGPVDDRAERAAQPPAQPLRDVSRPGAV